MVDLNCAGTREIRHVSFILHSIKKNLVKGPDLQLQRCCSVCTLFSAEEILILVL